MKLRTIIWRNFKKNFKNYYLYVFALVFSVALYFSFVTIQYDPALKKLQSGAKGAAAIGASSILLVAIVAFFALYANNIFIKRRSKEIGLFQLIGLTKRKVFSLLSAENLMLYTTSLILGVLSGFLMSKLMRLVLYKILALNTLEAELRFSIEALLQTLLVFAAIYLLIMLMNYLFIRKQSILSLFQTKSKMETSINRLSKWDIVIGILGIGFIGGGYYLSSLLFSGMFQSANSLMTAMSAILLSVIAGTYLFYKGSVSFLLGAYRSSRRGYLTIKQVLSLSSVMFRMKSNAMLLTIITTISALSIGLLSLSYISYYSTESEARLYFPHDFGFFAEADKSAFTMRLEQENIHFKELEIPYLLAKVDLSDLFSGENTKDGANMWGVTTQLMPIISDTNLDWIDLDSGEVAVSGTGSFMWSAAGIKSNGNLLFPSTGDQVITQQLVREIESSTMASLHNNYSLIIDEQVYQQLAGEAHTYYGIELDNEEQQELALQLFLEGDSSPSEAPRYSQLDYKITKNVSMGLAMFIVGFLGLAFLITSGCILYFKQMDEGEDEKSSYTILRKIGFTRSDLLTGVSYKQLFNFGIPLIVGLSHSYFAVKSGWFFFGTVLHTPMLVVMILYSLLYSLFGILSVMHYKTVIRQSLAANG